MGQSGLASAVRDDGHAFDDPASWVPKPPPPGGPPRSATTADWHLRRMSDFAGRIAPPREWIVEDWIPGAQCTSLYGRGGVRKTDFLLQLMIALALGRTFLGRELHARPSIGLFCEDTEDEIWRRAERIARHYGSDLAELVDLNFISLTGREETELMTFDGTRMKRTERFGWLEEQAQQRSAALIVLDTGVDFYGGSEIARREVSQFIRALDGMAMRSGCAVLFSAHPSKAGIASGALDSGSTGWEAKVRARLTLHDPGADEADDTPIATPSDRRILTRAKCNYARQGETLELTCAQGIFQLAALDPEAAALRAGPRAAHEAAADARFLELLAKITDEGDYVHASENSRVRYAPAVFGKRPDRGAFGRVDFYGAMQRLRVAGRIRLQPRGGKQHGTPHWVAVPQAEQKTHD